MELFNYDIVITIIRCTPIKMRIQHQNIFLQNDDESIYIKMTDIYEILAKVINYLKRIPPFLLEPYSKNIIIQIEIKYNDIMIFKSENLNIKIRDFLKWTLLDLSRHWDIKKETS